MNMPPLHLFCGSKKHHSVYHWIWISPAANNIYATDSSCLAVAPHNICRLPFGRTAVFVHKDDFSKLCARDVTYSIMTIRDKNYIAVSGGVGRILDLVEYKDDREVKLLCGRDYPMQDVSTLNLIEPRPFSLDTPTLSRRHLGIMARAVSGAKDSIVMGRKLLPGNTNALYIGAPGIYMTFGHSTGIGESLLFTWKK